MLLARHSDGGRRDVDDRAVAVLVGRQREEGVGHRLRQLRPLPQAPLPQLLPEFCRRQTTPRHSVRKQTIAPQQKRKARDTLPGGGGGDVVRRVVRHEVAEVDLAAGGGGGGGGGSLRHGCSGTSLAAGEGKEASVGPREAAARS